MNYNLVIQNDGSNSYPAPHMSKQALERKGILPITLPVLPYPDFDLSGSDDKFDEVDEGDEGDEESSDDDDDIIDETVEWLIAGIDKDNEDNNEK